MERIGTAMGPARASLVLVMVALTAFVTTLDNTVVNVAMPTIQHALGLSLTGLEWVAVSYIVSFASLLLFGGRLTDLYGARRVLLWGLGIFTGAAGIAGLAADGPMLIAARTVQGAGAALVIPAALAVVLGGLPARRRSAAVGVWMAALASALALGPLVGGIVTQRWGWPWIFLLNVPCGLLAALLTLAVPGGRPDPPEPGPGRHRGRADSGPGVLARALDLPGLVLSAAAVACLTYGLLATGARGRAMMIVVAAALAASLGFIVVEWRTVAPMVDPRLLRSRPLTGGAATQMLWGVGVNGVFFFTSLYLQRVLGFSPTRAGLAFLPLAGVLIVTTPVGERMVAHHGPHRVVPVGLLLVAAGMLLVAAIQPTAGQAVSFWELQPGLALVGGGSALTTSLTTSSLADVPASRTGTAAGLVSAAREVSGAFGVVLVGALLTAREHAALRAGAEPTAAFVTGYAAGLRLAAFLVACGAVIAALTLPVTQPSSDGSSVHAI